MTVLEVITFLLVGFFMYWAARIVANIVRLFLNYRNNKKIDRENLPGVGDRPLKENCKIHNWKPADGINTSLGMICLECGLTTKNNIYMNRAYVEKVKEVVARVEKIKKIKEERLDEVKFYYNNIVKLVKKHTPEDELGQALFILSDNLKELLSFSSMEKIKQKLNIKRSDNVVEVYTELLNKNEQELKEHVEKLRKENEAAQLEKEARKEAISELLEDI